MSGGVVYGYEGGDPPRTGGLGKWSPRMAVEEGAVPPGTWLLNAAATLDTGGGGTRSIPAGTMIESDGQTLTVAANTQGWILGERNKPVWPWPKPWPASLDD